MHQYSYRRKVLSTALLRFFVSFSRNTFRMLSCYATCGTQWNYFSHAPDLLLLLGAFLLPGFIFPYLAGYAADRIPKRYVLFLAVFFDFLLFLTGLFAYICSGANDRWIFPAAVFLVSAAGCFFETAYEALLPELFPEAELSRAEGLFEALNYIALVSGVSWAMGIFHLTRGDAFSCGCLLLIPSFLAVLSSLSIPHVISAMQKKKELFYHFSEGPRKLFSSFRKKT